MTSFLEISPSQIERLDEHQLVELLRRLAKAEMLKNGIPLRDVNVPTQIHIADGGEDGRVSWGGGINQTDYFPSRYTVFQCKRSAPGPTGCKTETWKKGTGTDKRPAEINDALAKALSNSGSYILATCSAVVGTKVDDRIDKIKEGIREAGYNPDFLSDIRIYDANQLSNWAATHPTVALWLNEVLQEVDLGGLQPFEQWSLDADISQLPFQTSEEPRFLLRGISARQLRSDLEIEDKPITFDELKSALEFYFNSDQKSLRITGASGFGKTRLVHALFSDNDENTSPLDPSAVIYCDFGDVSGRIGNLCLNLASTGSDSFLVVDDCPDNVHNDLHKKIQRVDSKTKIITLNVETNTQGVAGNLVVELQPASEDLISKIVKNSQFGRANRDLAFIRELAHGFPRMALVAAEAAETGDAELLSVDALIHRILWGTGEQNQESLETLQLFSLFTMIGVEGDHASELDQLAAFEVKPSNEMFRSISTFAERGIVGRSGDFADVRPLPLAVRLSIQWLNASSADRLRHLFEAMDSEMKFRLLGRLRWLSFDGRISDFAAVAVETVIPDEHALDTDEGSKFMDRLVHLEPDVAMETFVRFLSGKTVDELLDFTEGRRNTVWALEKLVFRDESFNEAARLLLKLAAAENESWGNNARGQFLNLFQLRLSGTEVEPGRRLEILDAGLQSTDERTQSVCVDALGKMLETGHFTRGGGNERIGYNDALRDWQPAIYNDIFDFYNEAVDRLTVLAIGDHEGFSSKAMQHLGSHIRGLMVYPNIFENLKAQIGRILEVHPTWSKPVKSVNSWLFFDSKDAPTDYLDQVHRWYDELFPVDDEDQLLLLSSGWRGDFHDPYTPYDPENDTDHNYAASRVCEIVENLSLDANNHTSLLTKTIRGEHNSSWTLGYALAQRVEDPIRLMQIACEQLGTASTTNICLNTFAGIISGAYEQNRALGLTCLETALAAPEHENNKIALLSAAKMDEELVAKIIQFVSDGEIDPKSAATLSCGRGFDDLEFATILPLAKEIEKTSAEGIWSALDLVYMYKYGQTGSFAEKSAFIKELCVHPDIFKADALNTMDAHHWESSVEKIFKEGLADVEFVELIVSRSLDLAINAEHDVQLEMDDAAYKVLSLASESFPSVVWESILAVYAETDGIKEWRLNSLLKGPERSPGQAGILAELPEDTYQVWLAQDPTTRLEFILEWVNLFEAVIDGNRHWSTEFIKLITEHASDVSQLGVVYSRLLTGVSWGPFSSRLKPLVPLFESLRNNTNPIVRSWANGCVRSLRQNIDQEERREANRDAGYRQ